MEEQGMNKIPAELHFEFGDLAKPIKEQLKNQGISIKEKDAECLEEIAHAIVLLHLHDIIPDHVRDNARCKLIKKIIRAIEKANK